MQAGASLPPCCCVLLRTAPLEQATEYCREGQHTFSLRAANPCAPQLPWCSVHACENEGVVAAVLEAAAALGFQLEDPFPAWPRRGVEGLVEGADRLVRVDPDEDGTDGFFVAVFAKQAAGGGGSGGGGLAPAAGAADAAAQAGQQAKKKRKKQKS